MTDNINILHMAILWLAILPTSVLAWNPLGHKVVAEIAWQQLDVPSRQEIVEIIRRHPRFAEDFVKEMPADVATGEKALQDHWIFQQAANWPDIARGIQEDEQKIYNHPTWHYIDLPLYLDPKDRRAISAKLPVNNSYEFPTKLDQSEWNIVQATQHCLGVIKQRTAGANEKAVAYCWLFHLVGDSHQPFHSTGLFSMDRFPTSDRGGNDIPLIGGSNLHALWDNLLGKQYYLNDVLSEVVELKGEHHDVWESAQGTDIRKWIAESNALARTFAYDSLILSTVRATPPEQKIAPISLPEAYLKEAGRIARRRVIAAGLRLGALLKRESGAPAH